MIQAPEIYSLRRLYVAWMQSDAQVGAKAIQARCPFTCIDQGDFFSIRCVQDKYQSPCDSLQLCRLSFIANPILHLNSCAFVSPLQSPPAT